MLHHWVYDVLSDLHAYATMNKLPDLAEKVLETLDVARREIAAAEGGAEAPSKDQTRGRTSH